MATVSEPNLQLEKPAPVKLYTAMHKARAAMPMVGKGGLNKFDNYKYATLADYIEAIQKPLDDHGLVVVSHIDDISWQDDRITDKGKSEKVVRIMLKTTVIHAESGESMSVTVLGEGQDRGDKAFYKADTGARKYALANLFNLATDDDPETDSPQGDAPKQQAKSPAQKPNGQSAQNFTPPPGWPETPVPDLVNWVSNALTSAAHFELALGLFQSESGLMSILEEWEPVLFAIRDSYKAKAATNPKVATHELNARIKAALDKLTYDKEADRMLTKKPAEEATT